MVDLLISLESIWSLCCHIYSEFVSQVLGLSNHHTFIKMESSFTFFHLHCIYLLQYFGSFQFYLQTFIHRIENFSNSKTTRIAMNHYCFIIHLFLVIKPISHYSKLVAWYLRNIHLEFLTHDDNYLPRNIVVFINPLGWDFSLFLRLKVIIFRSQLISVFTTLILIIQQSIFTYQLILFFLVA